MPTSRYTQDWKKKSTVDWSKYLPKEYEFEIDKPNPTPDITPDTPELEIDKPNPTPDIDPSLSDAGRSMFSKTLDLLSPTKFTPPAPVPMTDQGKTELGNTLNLMDPNKWSMASGLSSLAQNPVQGPPSLDPVQGPPSPPRNFWSGFEDTFGEPGRTISNAAGTLWDETKQAGDYAGQFADKVENGFDSFTQQAKDAQKNSFLTRGLNALGDSLGSVADVADNAAKGTFQQAKDATKDSVFTRGFSQPDMPNRNLFDETMASQRAGTADVLETAGNTAEWAGENLANAADSIGFKTFANDLRTGSVNTGSKFRNDADVQKNGFEIQPDHEFTWSDLLDPHAYARWSRSVPLSASLMSMSFAGGGIADTLGFVKNASPFVRELLTAGGAGAFSGAVESAVQAGNIYEEARTANNMDPQTALHAANIDFMKNLPLLMGSNALEFATAFMPKGVSKALDTPLGQVGRFIGSGLQEGGEEAAQEVIDRQALGKEVKWDSNMQEQFTVGALMGMGMGTAGVIMHNMDSIVNRVKGKMNDETRAEFNDLLDEAKSAGIPEEEATKQALDAMAEHPDAKPLFQEAVQEVMQSQQTAAQAKAPVEESIQKVIDGAGETSKTDEQPHDEAFQKLIDDISKQLNPQAPGNQDNTLAGSDQQNAGNEALRSPGDGQTERAPYTAHLERGALNQEEMNWLLSGKDLNDMPREQETKANQKTPAPENGKFYTPQELEGLLAGDQPMTPRQEEYEKVRKAFPEANLAPYQEAPSNQTQAPAETKPAGAANVGDTVTLRGMKGNYTVTGQSGKDMLKLKSESGGEVTVHKSAVTGLSNQPSAAPEVQEQRFPVPTQPTPKNSAYPDAHEEVAPVVKGTGVKLDYKIETTKPGVKYPKGRERIIVTRGDRKFYYEIGEKGDRSDYIHPDDQANFRDSGGFEGTKGLIGDPNHPVNNPANHMPEMTGKPFLMHKDDFINYLEGRDYKANINKRKYRDVPKDFSPTHVFRDGRKVQVEINKDQTVARWHAEDGEFGSTALDDFDAVPINKMIGNGSQADMGQIREHLSQFKRNDYVMFTHDGERKAGRILNENTAHNVRIMLMDENLKPMKGDLTLELTDPAVMTLQPSSREAIKGFKGGEVIDMEPKKDIGDVMGNDHANDPQEKEIPDKAERPSNMPDFETSIRHLDKEVVGFFDETGTLVHQIEGKKEHVILRGVKHLLNSNTTTTHNHPDTGGTFSYQDFVAFMESKFKEFRAVDATYDYSFTWKVDPSTLDNKTRDNILYSKAPRMKQSMKAGDYTHEVWEKLASESPYFDYNRVEAGQKVEPKPEPKQEEPASKKEKPKYGRSGAAAFRKEVDAVSLEPDTADYQDFENFFEKFYNAGLNEQQMPRPDFHHEQARIFYEAGRKDATKTETKQSAEHEKVQLTDKSIPHVPQRIKIQDGRVTVQSTSTKLNHEQLPKGFDGKSLTGMSYSFALDDYLQAGKSFGNPHYAISQFIKKQFDYQGMLEKHDYSPVIDQIVDSQIRGIEKAIAQLGIETGKVAVDRKPAAKPEAKQEVPAEQPKAEQPNAEKKFENLHFALSGNADEMEMIRRQKPKAILMSYGSRWERNGKIKEFVDSLGYRPVTIADNGAYSKKDTGLWDVMDFFENEWTTSPGSAWNTIKEAQQSAEFATKQGKSYMVSDGAKEIKKMFPEFVKFVDWLESNQGAMDYVIAPDDLSGDIEERSAKSLYAYQFFKGSDAYNFIPAFHYGADLSHLKDLIDEGADYIALGGSVYDPDVVDSKGNPTLMKAEKRAAWVNSIVNQHPDIKFHLLGTNDQGLIDLIPNIYSVDGSTWGRNSFQKESGFENRVDAGTKEIDKREAAAYGKKADPGTFTLPDGADGYSMTENEVTYHVVKHLFDTMPSLVEIVQDNNVNDASRKVKKELMKQKFKAKGGGFLIEVRDDPNAARKDDAEAGIYIDIYKHGPTIHDKEVKITNFRDDVVKLYKERISQGLGPVPQHKVNEDFSNVVEDKDEIRATEKATGTVYEGTVRYITPGSGTINLVLSDGQRAAIPKDAMDQYDIEIIKKAEKKRIDPYPNPYEAKIGKNIDFSADGGIDNRREVWHKDHPADAVTIEGYGKTYQAVYKQKGASPVTSSPNISLQNALTWASNYLEQKYGKGGSDNGTQSTRADGQRALAETPAEDVQGTIPQRDADASPAASAGPDGSRVGTDGEGPSSEGSGTRGSSNRTEDAAPSSDSSAGVGNGEGAVDSTSGRGGRTGHKPGNAAVPKPNGVDFAITTELDELGGQQTKFKNNVEALRLLHQIESENRQATSEEQAQLAKYVGWGGLANAFAPNNEKWRSQYTELRKMVDDGILSKREYDLMSRSTQYAHYTSKEIISAMYNALDRMGFSGGRVLEPAVGTGNFFGLMPQLLKNTTVRTGVEMDHVSGRIAKLLYPNANIEIKPFQDLKVPDGYFDLAIGNPPFSPNTLPYNKTRVELHNYFFLQSLDKVRDGGIVAFVTSSGTLNSKSSKGTREKMGEKANFLGAIRLPGDAFKKNAGTEVTTDIIFFQKRPEGEAAKHKGKFTDTATIQARNVDGVMADFDVNQYFADNPHMVLGEYADDKLHPGRLGVKSDGRDLSEALNQAIKKLPKNIYTERAKEAQEAEAFQPVEVSYRGKDELDEGAYAEHEGKIIQRTGDRTIDTGFTGKKAERVRGMIQVRDAARNLIRLQRESAPESEKQAAQKELNTIYDKFVKNNGFLNDNANMQAFKGDSIGAGLLLALEKPNGAKWAKEDFFTKMTVQGAVIRDKVDTSVEALTVSLFETGTVDFDRMASLTSKDKEEVLAELENKLFRDPAKSGDWGTNDYHSWVTEDEYLSGNVRKKLQLAEEAAAQHPSFGKNVKALKEIQPVDKTPEQIYVQLGTPWIPTSDVKEFIDDFLEADHDGIKVFYNPLDSSWNIQGTLPRSPKNTDEYGVKPELATKNRTALDLIEDALNLKKPVINYTVDDKTVTDEEATADAQAKQAQINMVFQEWIWNNKARSERLAEKYNWEYNNTVQRHYNGELIYGTWEDKTLLPGATLAMRTHQRNAIWRAVQGGNTILAHVVGAGKTFEMISSAMEMKRLGLVNKPMLVVPNHLLGQWQVDFNKLYPGAKVLVVSNDDIPSVGVAKGQIYVPYKKGMEIKPKTKIRIKGDDKVYWVQENVADTYLIVKTQKGKPFQVPFRNVAEVTRDQSDAEFAEKQETQRAYRAGALSKIAVGSYDAVLITHSTFQKLPMSPESYQEYIQEQVAEVEEVLRQAQVDDDKENVKRLEASKEALENKLRENLAEESKDIAIPFEELGVDQLFIDEAHMFKNLQFHTKMRNIAGLPNNFSQRAEDMFLKTRYLTKLRNGRGVIFATGTPISNTIAELFTMTRYLVEPQLKDMGIAHFDAWAANYGEMTVDMEMNAAGQYVQKERFARFKNLSSLLQIAHSFMDIQTADMLDLPRPKHIEEHTVTIPMSLDQEAYMKELVERAGNMKNVDPSEDNWLKLTGDGRKMALDIRLVDPSKKEFTDSKVVNAVKNIASIYHNSEFSEHKDGGHVDKHTQLVFLDLGTPKAKVQKDEDADKEDVEDDAEETWTDSIYNDLRNKLIASGVPVNEIAFIHDYKTKKRKEMLFAKVNNGDIRILIGSTEKMGAGMNVQKKVAALHHIDAPWRPSDVEQREGRMVRQGNENARVHVYSYVTKGSFDGLMWGILKRKAEMINQMMSGKLDVDEIEDAGVMVFKYAEVEAAASDNPLIPRKLKLEKEISLLARQKSAHESSTSRLRAELRDIPNEISYHQREIGKIETDHERAAQVEDKDRILIIGKKRFDKPTPEEIKADAEEAKKLKAEGKPIPKKPTYRELAGKALIAEYEHAMKNLNTHETATIGSFAGFELQVLKRMGSKIAKDAGVVIISGANNQRFEINTESDTGTYDRVVNAFEKLTDVSTRYHENQIQELMRRSEDIPNLLNKKFGKEEELQGKQVELREVVKELLALNNANDQAATGATEQKSAEQELTDRLRGQQGNNVGFTPFATKKPLATQSKAYASDDPEVERRLEAASYRPPNAFDKFKEWLSNLGRQATREFQHLPHQAKYAKVRFELHRLQKAPAISKDTVIRNYLTAITNRLNTEDYKLMVRIAVLRDLKSDMDRGVALKFGYSPQLLEDDLAKFEEAAKNNPKIQDALSLRDQLFKEKTEQLVEAYKKIGVDISEKFQLENYFRHLVLEYVNGDKQISAAKKMVRARTNSGYMRQRDKDSDKDFVVDMLTADAEVLTAQLTDMVTAETLAVIMHDPKLNIKDQLKTQARTNNQDQLDALFQAEIDSKLYMADKLDKKGNKIGEEAISPSELEYKQFAVKIAIGLDNLSKMARNGLWTGNNGEFKDVVASLIKTKDAELDDENPTQRTDHLFKYLSALLASGEDGASSAGMVFKAVQNRKQWVKEHINFQTWENVIPEGYSKFEPSMSQKFYPVQEIDVTRLSKDLAAGILTQVASAEDLEPYLQTAFKKTQAANVMVIPDELAATLLDISDTHERSTAYKAIKAVNNVMKQNLLFAGPRFIQYEIRNFSSDIEKLFQNKPSAFLYLKRSAAEMYRFVMKDHVAPNENVKNFAMMGGLQTLYGVAELGDLHKMEQFTRFYDKDKNVLQKTKEQLWDRYWRVTRRVDTLRETTVRYALYLSYLDELEKSGGQVKNYGSAKPLEVDALDTNEKKAFLLANEAIIDYSKTSHLGRRARDTVAPFWSFQEGNTRSNIQWMRNVIHDNKIASAVGQKLLGKAIAKTPMYALRVGKAYLAWGMLAILLAAWNHGLHGDEENELPEDIRNQLHIIWGRDPKGNIMYTSSLGAAEDFFKWVGMDDMLTHMMDLAAGRRTFQEVATAIVKTPVNKLVGLVNPIAKNVTEGITGYSLYPDVFNPQNSGDGFDEKMIQLLGVGNEYKRLKKELDGTPTGPYSPLQLLTTLKDPGEAAYYDVKDMIRLYEERSGKPAGSFSGEHSPKSNALYKYKLALKYGDQKAADRYIQEYVELGGNAKGMHQGLESLNPLSGLDRKDKALFLGSLSDKEMKRFDQAMDFYTDTLLGSKK